jgi:hypothetical protein
MDASFIPREFSLSPVDLIDPDLDDDEPLSEADARELHYRQFARAIDREDLKQIIPARLAESTALDTAIEDALETPIGHDRIDVHVNDRLRLANSIFAEIRDAADELIELYAAGEEVRP